MKKRNPLPLTMIMFFCSCVCLFADDWSISQPQEDENFFPTSNIKTKGTGPAETDVVIKLEDFVNGEFVTGASHDTTTGDEESLLWEWDFPAPQDGWRVSDQWTAILYLDATPLKQKETQRYKVVDDGEGE